GDFSAKTLTFAGNATITSQATGTVGLIVKAIASQSANLQEWQDSSGTALTNVSSDGRLRIGTSTALTNSNATHQLCLSSSTSSFIVISQAAGSNFSGLRLQIAGVDRYTSALNSTGDSIFSRFDGSGIYQGDSLKLGSNGQVTIAGFGASTVGLVVKGAASQTADLQQWQNSTGSVLASISANGTINTSLLKVQNIIDSSSGGPTLQFNNSSINIWTFTAASIPLIINAYAGQTSDLTQWKNSSANVTLSITPDGSIRGGNSSTISANTATTVDTVALSSFTTIEYVVSIKQGSKIRSSKVLVHTDGTSVDSTEYGIMEMGGGITGILVSASVSSTNSILQVTITDAATTNATVKLIKTML
ncbi:hypothetical protein EB001_24520, partial [bacterium]|nr:hypothetical protein [bacterium]